MCTRHARLLHGLSNSTLALNRVKRQSHYRMATADSGGLESDTSLTESQEESIQTCSNVVDYKNGMVDYATDVLNKENSDPSERAAYVAKIQRGATLRADRQSAAGTPKRKIGKRAQSIALRRRPNAELPTLHTFR